ncbi:hypothetical protein ACIQNG_26495 [Streptomyces sp. NPDC091377]|uniref:hypothetical protein n=1 Tax=Streptomyces sp. NPDC091377 TaxID=3365995 RepID=UPI0037F42B55
MAVSRLAPGVEIVDVAGLGLAVRTPDGEFLRVDTGGVAAKDLLARLEGGPEGSQELESLVRAFEDAGYAGCAGSPAGQALAGRAVLVLGDEPLAGDFARRVAAEGADVTRLCPADVDALAEQATHGPEGMPTVVVWCLDSPATPGLWDAADTLPAKGVGWLRCHREGFQAWLEPLAAGPGDVTSADVRLRRLAVSPAHRELAAYWEGRRTAESGAPGTAASAALIAELLTADLLAWADGRLRTGRLPVRRRLRRVDLRDLSVSEHPVLPVPRVAPLPPPRTHRAAGISSGGTSR